MMTILTLPPLAALQVHQKAFENALARVPENRSYALTDVARRSARPYSAPSWNCSTAHRPKTSFATCSLSAPRIKSLVQSRKPQSLAPLPKLWTDEVTGQPLPNPFAIPEDRPEQFVLRQKDPALAAHLEALAKNPYEVAARLAQGNSAAKNSKICPTTQPITRKILLPAISAMTRKRGWR